MLNLLTNGAFYPWILVILRKYMSNAETYVHLNLNVQPSFGLKTVNSLTTTYWIPSLRIQLFQWLSGSKWKSRQTWIQAQRKQISGQTWNPEKPEKQSSHSIKWIVPLFFLIYFSPIYYSALVPIGRHLWIMIWLWKKLDIRGLQKT